MTFRVLRGTSQKRVSVDKDVGEIQRNLNGEISLYLGLHNGFPHLVI